MSELKPVIIRGEGIIGPDGAWYPEAQVKAAVQRISELCNWFNSLPATVQDLARWEVEMNHGRTNGP